MVTSTISRRSSRRRARERGAAVFIVVLLLAMLTTVGYFAANAATVSTSASGHARQSAQTRYLAELFLQTVTAELASPRGPKYVLEARLNPKRGCGAGNPDPVCCAWAAPTESCCEGAGATDACLFVDRGTLEDIAGPMLVPTNALNPGSLGWADLDWYCWVSMSDPAPATPPPAGYDLTSAGATNVEPVQVTLASTCAVWPRPGPSGDKDSVVASTATQELLSAHVVVNNVPKL
jgi:hypothetical protein